MIRYEIVNGDAKIYGSGSFVLYSDHISELEKEKERADRAKEQNNLDIEAMARFQTTIEGLEERVKELSDEKLNRHDEVMMWVEKCNQAELRLKGLEEAVEEYKAHYTTITTNMFPSSETIRMLDNINEELYKVLEKVK